MKNYILLLLITSLSLTAWAQKKVVIVEVRKEIDPRMNRHVAIGLEFAKEQEADAILIDMDTYGGVLTDAKEIVDLIMKVDVPVWVYINSDAASAGALISIGCDSIYMNPGSSIGAATVVTMDGQKAPDKYQSYMRSVMRSTAEVNNRNPLIAEGMVDEALEIPGIKKAGQIITFSTSEAIANGFCEAQVNSIDEILVRNQFQNAIVIRFEPGVVNKVVDFFMNPVLSGILIMLILAGIYFELQSPGAIIPALISTVALILYLIPYYLNGLAENWEVLTLILGFIFLAVEILIIPGFGLTGITGLFLIIGSLVLIMVNNNNFDFEFVRMNDILLALATVMSSLLIGAVLMFTVGLRFFDSTFMRRMALNDTQARENGFSVAKYQINMVGKIGVVFTELRPSGKILLDNQVVDAYTRTGYIEKGKEVEILSQEGVSLLVKEK